MANLPDNSGDAFSNIVNGTGTNSLTFTMPGGVALAPLSVVAEVDNSAGGDTTATLIVRDSSGEVIDRKRQGATIDAGASTFATWALRLDDETTAATDEGCAQTVFAFMDAGFQLHGQEIDTRPIRKAIAQAGACFVFMSRTQQLALGEGFFVNGANVDSIAHDLAGWDGWITRVATNQVEQITGSTQTIAAGGTGAIAWAHGAGAAILNFAAPTLPTVPAAGVYAVDLNMSWT